MGSKISIVTVCYNAECSLESTMLSVLSQTYSNIEYIIIDGGSSDGTMDIIKRYKDKIQFWISEPDKGIFDAMNKGLEHISGEWVAFMNAGDCYSSETVLSDIFGHKSLESYDVIYGDMYAVYNKNKKKYVCAKPFFEEKKYIMPMGFSHQCVFVKTEKAKIHRFDLSFKITADYNMIYKIYLSGGRFYYYANAISDVAIEGFSSLNRKCQLKEICKITGHKMNIVTNLVIKVVLFRYKVSQIKNHLI